MQLSTAVCRQHSFYYLGAIAAGEVASLKQFQVPAKLRSQVPEQYREPDRDCFLVGHSPPLTSALLDQRTAAAQ
jgi:hypothetical protein